MLDFISSRNVILFSFKANIMIRPEIREIELKGSSYKFINPKQNQISTGNAIITQENTKMKNRMENHGIKGKKIWNWYQKLPNRPTLMSC